ncbi:MAG TPA: flavoprotein, partial [Turneriella sp.]|nr:flavoprotein [Turneriella sp.]
MKIIFGVSASVAIYRACDLVRELTKAGHEVHVVMTRTAASWINPVLFEALSDHPVVADATASGMAHIEIRKGAQLMLVAPASADLIARAAHGRADDILTATLLAYDGPRWLAPAMNPSMYAHPATQASLATCQKYG